MAANLETPRTRRLEEQTGFPTVLGPHGACLVRTRFSVHRQRLLLHPPRGTEPRGTVGSLTGADPMRGTPPRSHHLPRMSGVILGTRVLNRVQCERKSSTHSSAKGKDLTS